jgi:hypothetical protein
MDRTAELLGKIRQSIPPKIARRYRFLIKKRRAETIEPAEYDELLRLTDEVEQMNVVRLENIILLARLQGKTLPEMMHEIKTGLIK